MLGSIGNFLQIFAIAASISVIGNSLLYINTGSKSKYHNFSKASPTLFSLSSVSIILSFFSLIYGFVTSDFSLQNIFLNSSTLKPLIFKVAGSWSSHEGSILLWLCLLQIVSLIYLRFNDKHDKIYSLAILALLQLLFVSFIYFTSNPFISLSFTPKQGLGLNPMLQDIALAIHPPILYSGYVSYVVPFVISLIMLIKSHIEPLDLLLVKIFSGIATLLTITGIALGSWWAYRELGWGGFWFFDPVENISLFPFLSGVALYHCALVSQKTGKMIGWTITLSIVTFLLVIFSTFLVRSGFIISIHSFAQSPARAIYMLIIFGIIVLGSLGLLLIKRLDWTSVYAKAEGTSRKQLGIILGNICFLVSLSILISATLYPVIYSLFDQQSIVIDSEFFINNFLIFTVPILLLISLYATYNSWKKYAITGTISVIIAVIILRKIDYGVISASIIISSLFLILQNIYFVIERTNCFKVRLKSSTVSMVLGHVGFGMLALSITLNVLFQNEADFIGTIGETRQLGEFKVTMQNIKFSKSENYYRQIAELWLEDKQNNITILNPENRFYIIEKSLSQESDIYSYLTYDLYSVLSKIDGDIIHAKIYYQPMMSFIWISVIIMVSGFLIAIIVPQFAKNKT